MRSKLIGVAVALAGIATVLAPGSAPLAAPDPGELEAARDRLFELERDFQLVSEEYNLVRDDLVAIQAQMAQERLTVRRIQARMASKEKAAIDVATQLYKSGLTTVAIESLLSAESLAEVENRIRYLRSSHNAQTIVFERLEIDQELLERHLAILEEDRVKALAAEQRLADLRGRIETKLEDQKDEVAELNAAIERARAAAAADTAGVPLPDVNIRPAPAPNPKAQAAVDAALSQVGKPYQYGAAGPDSYDCSGLTMWSWAQAGVSLPHNSGAQYSATPRVDRSDLAPGDLLFFGSPIHHVAMYIGNGQMVEAPYSGRQVRVVSMARSDYVGAGRPGV